MRPICSILLVAVASSLGCAQAGRSDPSLGYEYAVYVDPDFAEDMQDVVDALAGWESISSHKLVFMVQVGPCESSFPRICIHSSTEAWILANGGGEATLGMTALEGDSAEIYIPSSKDTLYVPSEMTAIVAHEIGHGLGLVHTQPGTLMCWSTECFASLPTCDDWAQVVAYRSGSAEDGACPSGGRFVTEH